MKGGVEASDLRHIRQTPAQRLDQFDFARQVERIERDEPAQFVQHFSVIVSGWL